MHTLPLEIAQTTNPGISAKGQASRMQRIFDLPKCCRDEGCSEKVVNVFHTAEEAMNSIPFMHGLKSMVHAFKFTNMDMERLLGLIRRALDGHMSSSTAEAALVSSR